MELETINPTTGEHLEFYPETSPDDVQALLRRAQTAQESWRRLPFSARGEFLKAVAGRLRATRAESARLMALEMGKPIRQGRAEIDKCAWACEFFSTWAERLLSGEPVELDGSRGLVVFEPLGVILAIMPWNFPFWQVVRCAAPALMAGNAVVLKHASNVSGCALAIERLFREAGLPSDLFRTVLLPSAAVGGLIQHPAVRAVSLTGSVAAGKAVAALAGAHLKKTVLELGGSDPYVVLEDCDLGQAVEACVQSRLINSGQSCVAAKRFIVVDALRAEFEERFLARMKKERCGDPLSEETTVGPLAREDLRQALQEQVEASVRSGARLALGGRIPEGRGWFYPPTVLAGVRPGMAAFQEETFGPVAAMVAAPDERSAIRMANDTSFGLGAAVFTRDLARGERIAARELEAGNCCVNDLVRSDPRMPFGGIKDSGYGRELSAFGLREFVNIKAVVVR